MRSGSPPRAAGRRAGCCESRAAIKAGQQFLRQSAEGRVPDGVPAAVPGEVPAPDAGTGTADKIKLEPKLEPCASRNPPMRW